MGILLTLCICGTLLYSKLSKEFLNILLTQVKPKADFVFQRALQTVIEHLSTSYVNSR